VQKEEWLKGKGKVPPEGKLGALKELEEESALILLDNVRRHVKKKEKKTYGK